MSRKLIRRLVSDYLALNDILTILDWEGVLFCTFVPPSVRATQPSVWTKICDEVFKKGKQKLNTLVRDLCPGWRDLIVGDLKNAIDGHTNESLLYDGFRFQGCPRPDPCDLTPNDRKPLEQNGMYTENLMDYFGATIAGLNKDPETRRFVSGKIFHDLEQYFDEHPGANLPDIYSVESGEPFPTDIKTVYFFLYVRDKTPRNRIGPPRWIMIDFLVREAVARIYDTSGTKDVFTGRAGNMNSEQLWKRINLLFDLCGMDRGKVKTEYMEAPIHLDAKDSGPLDLERLRSEFEGNALKFTGMPAEISSIRKAFREWGGNSGETEPKRRRK
jgi:hypothetical protein